MSGRGPIIDIGAEMARLLFDADAIQVSHEGPYILAAGWASPVYVDCRRLIGEPRIRTQVIELAITMLAQRFGLPLPFDKIVGGETAGIPWAAWIAERLDLPLLYVRKRPLGIGRNAQVEGGSAEGARVLLVDDLATDNASKAAFTRGLRTAGAIVTEAIVLFHNRAFPGGGARLEQLGLTMHALADWDDVLRFDATTPRLAPKDRALIELFLTDPAAWSADHMGRGVVATPRP